VVLNAWLKGLASGDQRRPMGSSSALEALRDDVPYKYTLLYFNCSCVQCLGRSVNIIIIIIINDSIYPAVSKASRTGNKSVVSRMIVQTDKSSSAA